MVGQFLSQWNNLFAGGEGSKWVEGPGPFVYILDITHLTNGGECVLNCVTSMLSSTVVLVTGCYLAQVYTIHCSAMCNLVHLVPVQKEQFSCKCNDKFSN